jgi:predicted nucleic acid-binding protein
MFTSLPAYYWDSCVMLSYINGDSNRLPDIEALLDRSGKDFRLVTSVLSIVEVAFAKIEQDARALSDEQAAAISKLWEPNSPITTSEFYQLIAEDAQALIREAMTRKWSLQAADAIHLATADRLKVVEFHTYDQPLEKYSEITKTKFKICAPTAAQLVMILDAKENEQDAEDSPVVSADDSSGAGNTAGQKSEEED